MSSGRTLRIAYVTDLMAVGGVETNLLVLGDHLRRRGHHVVIVSSGGALEPELATRGVIHIRLPIALRRPLALARAARAFPRILARERVDVVHAMSAAGNLVAAAVPRRRWPGVRFVSSPMGLQNSDRESRFVTWARNRLLALRVDRVLVISEEIGRALRSAGITPELVRERAVVGVDLAAFRPGTVATDGARAALRLPHGAFVVSTIGALHPRKRHDLFLRAAREVQASVPGARFLVVGEGAERASLESLRSELGLDDAVTFMGHRRDIRDIVAVSDVYVKPGIVEGFIGITVLEAQAAARPVVAFDTRDVRAAITDRETGLLVPNGEVGALAAAILELHRDRALAGRVAAAGRRRVEDHFSMELVAAGLETEYLDLLSRSR